MLIPMGRSHFPEEIGSFSLRLKQLEFDDGLISMSRSVAFYQESSTNSTLAKSLLF